MNINDMVDEMKTLENEVYPKVLVRIMKGDFNPDS